MLGGKNKQTKEFYQTGAAEYAQIQAACLCKLHNCLGRLKKKEKERENETLEIHLWHCNTRPS